MFINLTKSPSKRDLLISRILNHISRTRINTGWQHCMSQPANYQCQATITRSKSQRTWRELQPNCAVSLNFDQLPIPSTYATVSCSPPSSHHQSSDPTHTCTWRKVTTGLGIRPSPRDPLPRLFPSSQIVSRSCFWPWLLLARRISLCSIVLVVYLPLACVGSARMAAIWFVHPAGLQGFGRQGLYDAYRPNTLKEDSQSDTWPGGSQVVRTEAYHGQTVSDVIRTLTSLRAAIPSSDTKEKKTKNLQTTAELAHARISARGAS